MGRKERERHRRQPANVERIQSELAAARTENLELRRELARALKVIELLRKENEELQARLDINSQNSSMPPSSDPPDAPRREPKTPSGRAPGGQPGHSRNERASLPPERVTRQQECKPRECRACRSALLGEDPHPRVLQQVEVPLPSPTVLQFNVHALTCLACGVKTWGQLPEGIEDSPFGPRLQALIALYASDYRLSDRKIVAVLRDVHGVDISTGAVADYRLKVSDAVACPVEEAAAFARGHGVKYADETGWNEGVKRLRAWMWLLCTPLVTVFRIQNSRATEAAQKLLGSALGVLVTDRCGSYNWWPLKWRQICWSHLKRDFQRLIDFGGVSAKIGTQLQEERRQLFRWWYRVRDGTLSRASFRRKVAPLRLRVRRLLAQGAACRHARAAGICRLMLQVEPAFWTFVRIEGVEPTNNQSERSARTAVIKRKLSYGSHSPAGSRFVERMLTVTTTLRQQQRNVLQYLEAALRASIEGYPPPSLLPCATTAIATLP